MRRSIDGYSDKKRADVHQRPFQNGRKKESSSEAQRNVPRSVSPVGGSRILQDDASTRSRDSKRRSNDSKTKSHDATTRSHESSRKSRDPYYGDNHASGKGKGSKTRSRSSDQPRSPRMDVRVPSIGVYDSSYPNSKHNRCIISAFTCVKILIFVVIIISRFK